MQIIEAKKAGFCFGVKRAVDIAFNLADKMKEGVYTLGPIIHNPQVVNKLILQGIIPTEDIYSPDIKTLIIRTHGVSPTVYAEMSKMGYNLVDATCPFVKKAQKYAQSLKKDGYQVIIVGDREHPEVQSLIGFAGNDVIVVGGEQPTAKIKSKVGIIVQTTQPFEALGRVVSHVIGFAKELKVYNTICNSTAVRLEETKELAKVVDIMIIVGGKNSANTTQLANISRAICGKVYHIETADEIEEKWFNRNDKIGITGGASTPNWIIEEVVEKLKRISERR